MDWSNKDIRILTAEANGTKRQLLNKQVRAHGYHDVTGVAGTKDAFDLLRKEPFDWLILPFSEDSEPNSLAILDFVSKSRKYNQVYISFLLQRDLSECSEYLKKAFALGLFSYCLPYNSQTDIEKEFHQLFERIKTYQGMSPFIAATYLRQIFVQEELFDELLQFEKALNRFSCRFPRLILHLAEAYCLCNQKDRAPALLKQVLLLDQSLNPAVEALRDLYKLSNDSQGDGLNILGLEQVLIIEPKSEDGERITSFLNQLGITNIFCCQNARDGLEWLKSHPDTDLVICEWQQNDIPGPIVFQRIRALKIHVPLVAINETLANADLPIIKEMGPTHFIKKPFDQNDFYQEIFWIINQDREPSEPHMILQKMRQAQKDGDLMTVAGLKKKYFSHPKVTEVDKLYINAEISYQAGFYHKAKAYAIEALESGGDSLDVLGLLGKTLMQLREFEAALRCLENAQVISPTNIERMCSIAESHLELEDDKKFNEALTQAKTLDDDNSHIHIIEAKSAIKQGEHNKAKELMQKLDSLRDIIIFTNNRAVAQIRTDHYQEGVELYNDAILSIPDRETEILGTLYYNLGLARARRNELKEALRALGKGDQLQPEKIRAKIQSLKKRVENAILNNKPLNLKALPPVTIVKDSQDADQYLAELENLIGVLDRKPGSYNLSMIYASPKTLSKKVSTLLDKKVG